jgi:hypothetical protein
MKNDYLAKVRSINATIAVTFKTPKVAVLSNQLLEVPSPLSARDTDFFEQEVLRLFYINMSRLVRFELVAYPEDRSKEDNSFVPLHYHAVIRSENDAKFIAIAERKYAAVLESVYSKHFSNIIIPIEPLWISKINHDDIEKDYELYVLKQYTPSKRLVTHEDFQLKSIAA